MRLEVAVARVKRAREAPAESSLYRTARILQTPRVGSGDEGQGTRAATLGMQDPLATDDEVVAVVVVVRDRLSVFRACLDALYSHTTRPFRCVVVVGGADESTRRGLAELAARHGNLEVIEQGRPLSQAESRRLGLARVDVRRCVLLENDAIVDDHWLDPLLTCARSTGAAIVAPVVYWYRGLHAAGCSFERIERGGRTVLRHSIEYTGIRQKRIDYAETHCMLVDLAQVTLEELCDDVEPSDVDLGLAMQMRGRAVMLEPRSRVTYTAPPPIEARDLAHSLARWDLEAWRQRHARFVAKWHLEYDASAKHASYRRQQLRLAVARQSPAMSNLIARAMNEATTVMTRWRRRRVFG